MMLGRSAANCPSEPVIRGNTNVRLGSHKTVAVAMTPGTPMPRVHRVGQSRKRPLPKGRIKCEHILVRRAAVAAVTR